MVNLTDWGSGMRTFILGAALSMGLALGVGSPSFAQAADPTMNQIYDAAAAGHLDQAQQMITQVLADHPNSAKAHYVQAELYAKEGKPRWPAPSSAPPSG